MLEVNKGAKVRKGQCKAICKVVCTEEDPRDFSMARVVALAGRCVQRNWSGKQGPDTERCNMAC